MPQKKASKNSKAADSKKKKIVRKSGEFKKEIIAKYKSDVGVFNLAEEFGIAKSAINHL